MKPRLATLMFIQSFTMGATAPIFSHYLKNVLHFSGSQTGLIISLSALTALVSPLVGAVIADRILPSKYLYALLHLIAGALMFCLSYQTEFSAFFWLCLFYAAVFGPTNALVSAITFHQLPGQERTRFGSIRVWGTIGWIAVAWIFGYGWLRGDDGLALSRLGDALKLSAICSWGITIYALTLPSITISRPSRKFLPVEALQVLKVKEVRLLIFICFCAAFLEKYFYFGMAPYLKSLHFAEEHIMPAMTVAQFPEILSMLGLAWMLRRFGFKTTMLIGATMHCIRFAVLTFSSNPILTLMGTACHGGAYAFLLIPASIKIDSHCEKESRAGVHLISALATVGLAGLLSNNIAGLIMDLVQERYLLFWALPTILAAFRFILLWHFLPDAGDRPDNICGTGEAAKQLS